MSLTIDIAPLYDPIKNRYKGVYPGKGVDQWDAIVTTPLGKLERKGRFSSQEAAARRVAEYYQEVYGKDWPQALVDRQRRVWRIRRLVRYPYMANLHRGPATTVYVAEIRQRNGQYHRIVPSDLTENENASLSPALVAKGWNEEGEGWATIAIALVMLRMYRHIRKWKEALAEAA